MPILLILKPDSVKEKIIYLEVDGFISYPFNEKEIVKELKHSGRNQYIIVEIAEKYCGNINCDYSEEYFETKVILLAGNKE